MADKVLKDYRTRFHFENGACTRILELDWEVQGVSIPEHIEHPEAEDYSIAYMLWKEKK